MIDDTTRDLIAQADPTFNLHLATLQAVQAAVKALVPPDKTAVGVFSADLTGEIHLGVAVRAGDHFEIYGELAGHMQTKAFTGKVQVVMNW